MALLQPRLNLRVAQKQVLTPGLVQMVSLLALNKQELKEMIDAEIMENPVLEELDETVPSIDDVRTPEEADSANPEKKEESDPFDEIDFGSYFQDYLDPGYRTPYSAEIIEKASFENFLSKPTTLTDHLMWQLGSLHLAAGVREAAELLIGNLDEDGYLTASDEELLAALERGRTSEWHEPEGGLLAFPGEVAAFHGQRNSINTPVDPNSANISNGTGATNGAHAAAKCDLQVKYSPKLKHDLTAALDVVRGLDPVGIAARDLRECLLMQHDTRTREAEALAMTLQRAASKYNSFDGVLDLAASVEDAPTASHVPSESHAVLVLSRRIIDEFLPHLLKRDIRELSRLTSSQQPRVQAAIDSIRGLDPKPGQKYNREQVRLIEPDVAFLKRDDQYVILINDEEMPTLRLNQGYRRMLSQDGTEREVREYVKERYRSAIQLMRNIEQRKNTILRTCEVIIRRQREFLEEGVDSLKPMMIKDVAEEIGVHASTVSRAVANKYAHTPQGVFELRFFFTEGVNGPEGADTPLLLLKRKVKKMIEEENSCKPLTDDALASLLQAQGIAVNRRTVAKYREDMGIPSTHQRRVRI